MGQLEAKYLTNINPRSEYQRIKEETVKNTKLLIEKSKLRKVKKPQTDQSEKIISNIQQQLDKNIEQMKENYVQSQKQGFSTFKNTANDQQKSQSEQTSKRKYTSELAQYYHPDDLFDIEVHQMVNGKKTVTKLTSETVHPKNWMHNYDPSFEGGAEQARVPDHLRHIIKTSAQKIKEGKSRMEIEEELSENLLHPNVTDGVDVSQVDLNTIPETYEEMDLLNKKRYYEMFKNMSFGEKAESMQKSYQEQFQDLEKLKGNFEKMMKDASTKEEIFQKTQQGRKAPQHKDHSPSFIKKVRQLLGEEKMKEFEQDYYNPDVKFKFHGYPEEKWAVDFLEQNRQREIKEFKKFKEEWEKKNQPKQQTDSDIDYKKFQKIMKEKIQKDQKVISEGLHKQFIDYDQQQQNQEDMDEEEMLNLLLEKFKPMSNMPQIDNAPELQFQQKVRLAHAEETTANSSFLSIQQKERLLFQTAKYSDDAKQIRKRQVNNVSYEILVKLANLQNEFQVMSFVTFTYDSIAALNKLITRLDAKGEVEYDNYDDNQVQEYQELMNLRKQAGKEEIENVLQSDKHLQDYSLYLDFPGFDPDTNQILDLFINGVQLDFKSNYFNGHLRISNSILQNGNNTLMVHFKKSFSYDSLHLFKDSDGKQYIHSSDISQITPCFDQFDIKGTFIIRVASNEDWITCSNEIPWFNSHFHQGHFTENFPEKDARYDHIELLVDDLNILNTLMVCNQTVPINVNDCFITSGQYKLLTIPIKKYNDPDILDVERKLFIREDIYQSKGHQYFQNLLLDYITIEKQQIEWMKNIFPDIMSQEDYKLDFIFIPEFSSAFLFNTGQVELKSNAVLIQDFFLNTNNEIDILDYIAQSKFFCAATPFYKLITERINFKSIQDKNFFQNIAFHFALKGMNQAMQKNDIERIQQFITKGYNEEICYKQQGNLETKFLKSLQSLNEIYDSQQQMQTKQEFSQTLLFLQNLENQFFNNNQNFLFQTMYHFLKSYQNCTVQIEDFLEYISSEVVKQRLPYKEKIDYFIKQKLKETNIHSLLPVFDEKSPTTLSLLFLNSNPDDDVTTFNETVNIGFISNDNEIFQQKICVNLENKQYKEYNIYNQFKACLINYDQNNFLFSPIDHISLEFILQNINSYPDNLQPLIWNQLFLQYKNQEVNCFQIVEAFLKQLEKQDDPSILNYLFKEIHNSLDHQYSTEESRKILYEKIFESIIQKQSRLSSQQSSQDLILSQILQENKIKSSISLNNINRTIKFFNDYEFTNPKIRKLAVEQIIAHPFVQQDQKKQVFDNLNLPMQDEQDLNCLFDIISSCMPLQQKQHYQHCLGKLYADLKQPINISIHLLKQQIKGFLTCKNSELQVQEQFDEYYFNDVTQIANNNSLSKTQRNFLVQFLFPTASYEQKAKNLYERIGEIIKVINQTENKIFLKNENYAKFLINKRYLLEQQRKFYFKTSSYCQQSNQLLKL